MITQLTRKRTALLLTVGLATVASSATVATAASSAGAATAPTYTYSLGGSAELTARAKGTVPLSGTVAATVTPKTGAVTATVKLDTVTVNLKEYGFLPVQARVAFTSVGPTTGKLTGSTLTATSVQTIQLLSATVLGVNLVSGTTCQTITPSTITLTSTPFSLKAGGKLTGSFSISRLQDCGGLTWDLSDAIESTNNTVAATMTPKA